MEGLVEVTVWMPLLVPAQALIKLFWIVGEENSFFTP
jgi:hypothetical protein